MIDQTSSPAKDSPRAYFNHFGMLCLAGLLWAHGQALTSMWEYLGTVQAGERLWAALGASFNYHIWGTIAVLGALGTAYFNWLFIDEHPTKLVWIRAFQISTVALAAISAVFYGLGAFEAHDALTAAFSAHTWFGSMARTLVDIIP